MTSVIDEEQKKVQIVKQWLDDCSVVVKGEKKYVGNHIRSTTVVFFSFVRREEYMNGANERKEGKEREREKRKIMMMKTKQQKKKELE